MMSFRNGVYCTEGGMNINLTGDAKYPPRNEDVYPWISAQSAERFSPIAVRNMSNSRVFSQRDSSKYAYNGRATEAVNAVDSPTFESDFETAKRGLKGVQDELKENKRELEK